MFIATLFTIAKIWKQFKCPSTEESIKKDVVHMHNINWKGWSWSSNTLATRLTGKDPDAGRDWGQEEKGTTEDEMARWHHWLDGRESEWTLGVGDGQGGLVCCDSWGCKVSDMTEWLNWTELNHPETISPQSVEKLSPLKLGPGGKKKVGDHCRGPCSSHSWA